MADESKIIPMSGSREKQMQNTKISLIIPAYNEAAIIKNTVEAALEYLEKSFPAYELIISDDGSTDATAALVRSVDNPKLRLVGHKPNMGKGAAVREGILAADGELVVYTDADLAYGIDAVGELIKMLRSKNADIAIGSRKLHPRGYEDYPLIRLVASRLFSFLTGLVAGFHYDTQCGLKAFSSRAAKEIFSRSECNGFAFDFEVMMLAKELSFSVEQLPVKIVNHRDSKVQVLRDSIRMFGDIFKVRFAVKKRLEREIASD